MANLGDVLRHLVTHALGASPEDRAGMTEIVNEAYPPELPLAAPQEAPAADPQARIAELEAELAAAKASAAKPEQEQPPPGG